MVAPEASPAPNARPGFDDLIRRDPLAALEQAQSEHAAKVRDYRCTFVKQELLDSGLSAEQTIATSFRAEPYNVVMHWLKNPGKAERVIQTLLGEWAYGRPYATNRERLDALPAFVDFYNRRRPHTALGGRSPLDAVSNVPGEHS